MSQPRKIPVGVFNLDHRRVEVSVRAGDGQGVAWLAFLDTGQPADIGLVSNLHTTHPQLSTSHDYSRRQRYTLIDRTVSAWSEAFDEETI